jgi:hypothetical protein
MTDKGVKCIAEFTDNEKKAYKLVMKASKGKGATKRQLYNLLTKNGIYSKKKDRKEVIEMLVYNKNVPLSKKKGMIINKQGSDRDA